MIWSSIDTLHKNLDLIDNHLSNALINEKLIKNAAEGGNIDAISLGSNYTAEKRFRNKAVFISLYGAFEQFIEALLSDYIEHLQTYIPNFSELPKRVRNEYVEKWKKFHGKLKYPQYKDITEREIVENLHEVVCNDKNKIMPNCYKRNGGNYKYKVIRGTFYGIGIELDNVKRYFVYPIGDDITRFEAIQDSVDDLVERRNNIAHTATDDGTLLDIEGMKRYVNVIRVFSKTLFDYVQDVLLNLIWERKEAQSLVLKANRALPKPHVLYFENVKGAWIKSGQLVVVRLSDGNFPQFRQTLVDGISYSVNAGDEAVFVSQLDETRTYHDISLHFAADDVIRRNVQVLFL